MNYDFQQATADRIAGIFREALFDSDGHWRTLGGQRRVLLADEVGLGKTHVAKEVISRVREMYRRGGHHTFRVVYVCSNISLANQNIAKLGVHNLTDASQSRLSMQHLTIREMQARLQPDDTGLTEMIMPLTPSTSFTLRGNSMGMAGERALICTVLEKLGYFGTGSSPLLTRLFQGAKGDGAWHDTLDDYRRRVDMINADGSYLAGIDRYLSGDGNFKIIRTRLAALLAQTNAGHTPEYNEVVAAVNGLRSIFATLSVSLLQPDLIIMDEFQRFNTLLDFSAMSEQATIARQFFGSTSARQPLMLLMSATPYKPLTTLEELTENNADAHYEDFTRLIEFLFGGDSGFKEIWSDYSRHLRHLRNGGIDILLAAKTRAEDKMYEAICRTERLNQGLVSDRGVATLEVTADDVASFCEMDRIVSAAQDKATRSGSRITRPGIPVEYVKSAPYLLSFMDAYNLKKQLDGIYRDDTDHTLPKPSPRVLLRAGDIEQLRPIPMRNARMDLLRKMMFPEKWGAEKLLWVPPSQPGYTIPSSHPFAKNANFSKVLVFSAWEMVPRMIAVLLSYESEQILISNKAKKRNAVRGQRLRGEISGILTFPSRYLATLYNPAEHYGRKIEDIRKAVGASLRRRLEGIPVARRSNAAQIPGILQWLDDPWAPAPAQLPANVISLLTDMAIAAPGVCLYRILKDSGMTAQEIKEAGEGFVTLFNRRIASRIIDKLNARARGADNYLDGVMDYCVMGNLQAVLDEYRSLFADDREFASKMKDAFINEATLMVDTDRSFGRPDGKKMPMEASYAVTFSKSVTFTDEKNIKRTTNIRNAFQSPFYPFVLASTSVGQEGLDFHWYCRKILHWNLPSNPQDLEQREGRVNRYKCLAIRRNLARRYPSLHDWDEIFAKAKEDVHRQFGDKYPDIVPHWCLPPDWLAGGEESNIEWLERIIPQYPLSIDAHRYRRLIDVLSLYRLTLGQPRQEELVNLLAATPLTPAQRHALLFNLSPIARQK